MSTSIVYDGYLERYADGTCLAQLADLPGCFASGASPDEALQRLAGAIPAYYAWLARHDDYTPLVQGTFQVVAKESQAATPERGAFFTPDAAPVTAEDLDWYLALFGWAVDDLTARVQSLPTNVSEQFGPTGRDGLIGIGARLTRGLSYLLAAPELLFAAADGSGANVLRWLHDVTQACAAQLRSASGEERGRIVERDGARWSVRSVLRQAILDARVQLAVLETA